MCLYIWLDVEKYIEYVSSERARSSGMTVLVSTPSTEILVDKYPFSTKGNQSYLKK